MEPGADHFADQLELMAGGRMKRPAYSREAVQRRAVSAFGRAVRAGAHGGDGCFTVRAPVPVAVQVTTQENPRRSERSVSPHLPPRYPPGAELCR